MRQGPLAWLLGASLKGGLCLGLLVCAAAGHAQTSITRVEMPARLQDALFRNSALAASDEGCRDSAAALWWAREAQPVPDEDPVCRMPTHVLASSPEAFVEALRRWGPIEPQVRSAAHDARDRIPVGPAAEVADEAWWWEIATFSLKASAP